MRKITAIVIQVLILVAAWYFISDQITDNTYFGFVSYDVDVISENIRWTMLTAGILSVLNIWFWWPKKVKVANTPNEAQVTSVKAEEAKDKDPVVPKMD